MSRIELRGINKYYGKNHVLKDISLVIEDGEFMTLLGPSGCGKTTTLRMIAGLETPTSGRITIGDKVVFDSALGINVPANKRKVGFLFQNYALWPNMTVYQNIAFGLSNIKEPHRLSKQEIDETVHRVAQVVKITAFMDRYPAELSGGQQQRVAIARTLAPEPSVLFMDEPLSNLDAKLRLEMRYELQRLHVETGSTFVYVTHDQMEAMTLATQICLINNGVLQQYDAPLTVYSRPNNLFVADFVGNPSINFIEGKGSQRADGGVELALLGDKKAVFQPAKPLDLPGWFQDRDAREARAADEHKQRASEKGFVEKGNKDETFRYHIDKVEDEDLSPQEEQALTNEDLVLGVRPEFIDIVDGGALEGEIYGAMPTGMESTIKVRIGNFLLTGVVFGSTLFTIGSKVHIDVSGDGVLLFDRRSGQCIAQGSLKF